MKTFYNQSYQTTEIPEEDFNLPSLREDLEKTRIALDIAYAGFDNAVNSDMIDCYIYEINALLKRYKHLTDLAALEAGNSDSSSGEVSIPWPLRGLRTVSAGIVSFFSQKPARI